MNEPAELRLGKALPLKGIRKMIATRLGAVWREAVHVTLHRELDVTAVYEAKERGKLAHSVIDYLLFGLVRTLKEESFASFNGHFDGQTLQQFDSVHLGIAVDHPKGLVVPNLFDADLLVQTEFAERRKALGSRAKAWKQAPYEMENGTFTVTNLGPLGIDYFTPILNPPQTAIVGLGRLKVAEVSRGWEQQLVKKAFLPVSLTIDHRVLDGADAARFLVRWEELIAGLAAIG